MTIRRLDENTINRIAAGEVVERPASAVKELVENAIDAGAARIDVTLENGGKSLIRVEDDGCGMSPVDLALSLERHATSKLPDGDAGDNLFRITSLGFRGEALPSIGAVSKMSMTTRTADAPEASTLAVVGGVAGDMAPAAGTRGTRIEVRDLFFATPARLKFLKSERAEMIAVSDTLKRLAMAHAHIGFSITSDGRQSFFVPAEIGDSGQLNRLSAIMGRAFGENAVPVHAARDTLRLNGFAGLPTFNHATAQKQYLVVNGRPVRDKLLNGAVRAAYHDFLAGNRHPSLALFIDIDPTELDVNVHPAKTEVRFRDSALVRGMIVGALRAALAEAGHRASTTVADQTLSSFRWGASSGRGSTWAQAAAAGQGDFAAAPANYGSLAEDAVNWLSTASASGEDEAPKLEANLPLGLARAQLHETYILAQTHDGFVIVDQHAAHERLVYERMKRQIAENGIKRQILLVPEIVEMEVHAAERLISRAGELAELGFIIERFGPEQETQAALMVREVPALMYKGDVTALLKDMAEEIDALGQGLAVKEHLEELSGTLACHTAVRAGRRLSVEEMNAILRDMEATPHAGQCNHGRPTYVELKLADIERLFGRR